jgi:uncharacterized membrane protein
VFIFASLTICLYVCFSNLISIIYCILFKGSYITYQIFGRKSKFLVDFLEIKKLPLSFGGKLVGIIIANAVTSLLLNSIATRMKYWDFSKMKSNSSADANDKEVRLEMSFVSPIHSP